MADLIVGFGPGVGQAVTAAGAGSEKLTPASAGETASASVDPSTGIR